MRIQNNQGFTLIEILVSLTIFSVAVLGLAIGTVTLTRTNADSQLRATAINVALPAELAPAAHNAFVLPGTLVGGPMTRGLVQLTPSPRINVRLFNNGYPGGSGANIVVSGVYQTQ